MRHQLVKRFKFEVYHRPFRQALHTSHGVWQTRSGIVVTLIDPSGVSTQGEIAHLPWFGTETLNQALEFCQQLGTAITLKDIKAIPDYLPCCQFALESAWLNFANHDPSNQSLNLDFCCLLPAGEAALTSWQTSYQNQNITTFKWKIGVLPMAQEIELLKQLDQVLPPTVQLRLDANGGLNFAEAQQLLNLTDTLSRIEFVEQPLAVDEIAALKQLSLTHCTPIALDESVASFQRLQSIYNQGWSGIYVIKAAIMGFPRRLIQFCQQYSLEVVFSSVFETEVGRSAVLKMAQELGHPRALGFGTKLFL
ncbi:MAG: o-succinylbenzoate synthase [Cyanobacteria bacterium J06621_8]